MRVLLAGGLLAWWAVQTAAYLPVWNAPVTLAAHIAQTAPYKPRALVNYGTLLVLHQQVTPARTVLQAAVMASALPHVPAYDRVRARDAALTNLRGLATLEARGWRDAPAP